MSATTSAMDYIAPPLTLEKSSHSALPDDCNAKKEEKNYQCSTCRLHTLCLPGALPEQKINSINKMVRSRRALKRGDSMFRYNQLFTSVYAVRRGFFKTSVLTEDGRDQVTGFFMAGDILGFDGIDTDLHTLSAVAIEDSEVCVIPFTQLQTLAESVPGLSQQIIKIMSREIVRDQTVMLLLGSMCADERIASFLLNLSKRFVERGYAAQEFHLRMTREEIGSYLGLKLETVSRVFSRFQKAGLIEVQLKHVRILDIDGLKRISQSAA